MTTSPELSARPAALASGSEPPAKVPPRYRAHAIFGAKLLITAGALAFTFSRISLSDLSSAVRRLSGNAVILAIAVTLANLTLAGFRWRVLLAAYGAKNPPNVAFLARAQLVGHFYNTFVPGNVTGDAMRAHVTRSSFETPLGSYMLVGLERFFGLAGLFTVGAVGLLLHPLPGVVRADLLAGCAFCVALAIALVPIVGRKVGGRLPGRVGRWAQKLPVVTRPALLGIAIVLSLLTHTLVGLTGHLLIDAIAPQVVATESVVLVPLAMGSTYVPFTVAGLGVREGAFVFLLGKIGVASADATAASLSILAVYSIVALLGGLVHLVRPLRAPSAAR